MGDITERLVETNGIHLRVAEAGAGPLLILCHGFPELAYSWRHQMPALAAAGYRVVAPDMRGYGGSTIPGGIDDYDIAHITGDLAGLLDALDAEDAVFIGHDWGALAVWSMALFHPSRVRTLACLSVPFPPRGQIAPTGVLKRAFRDTFFYILYFQQPGVADADLDADPATTMRRLLVAISGDSDAAIGLAGPLDGRGFVERMPEPKELPGWLTQDDLDHFTAEFARTGFTGGLNWYRCIDRNWELADRFDGARIEHPTLFIAGTGDPVLLTNPPEGMRPWVPGLRRMVLIDGAGHWVQQEAPEAVNAALLDFLGGL